MPHVADKFAVIDHVENDVSPDGVVIRANIY